MLWSMLAAIVLATPLSGVTTSCGSLGSSAAVGAAGASAGIGCGLAWREVVRAMGWLPVVVAGSLLGACPEGSFVTSTGICGSWPEAGPLESLGADVASACAGFDSLAAGFEPEEASVAGFETWPLVWW